MCIDFGCIRRKNIFLKKKNNMGRSSKRHAKLFRTHTHFMVGNINSCRSKMWTHVDTLFLSLPTHTSVLFSHDGFNDEKKLKKIQFGDWALRVTCHHAALVSFGLKSSAQFISTIGAQRHRQCHLIQRRVSNSWTLCTSTIQREDTISWWSHSLVPPQRGCS